MFAILIYSEVNMSPLPIWIDWDLMRDALALFLCITTIGYIIRARKNQNDVSDCPADCFMPPDFLEQVKRQVNTQNAASRPIQVVAADEPSGASTDQAGKDHCAQQGLIQGPATGLQTDPHEIAQEMLSRGASLAYVEHQTGLPQGLIRLMDKVNVYGQSN
jgi:hypothetical protein